MGGRSVGFLLGHENDGRWGMELNGTYVREFHVATAIGDFIFSMAMTVTMRVTARTMIMLYRQTSATVYHGELRIITMKKHSTDDIQSQAHATHNQDQLRIIHPCTYISI